MIYGLSGATCCVFKIILEHIDDDNKGQKCFLYNRSSW